MEFEGLDISVKELFPHLVERPWEMGVLAHFQGTDST